MIRLSLLMLFVAFFSAYAWKNWFISLCAMILLMGVVEHPDFPKAIAGIPGMNPWNILLGNVFLAWLVKRGQDGYQWDMPQGFGLMLLGALVAILIGVLRLSVTDYPIPFTGSYIFSELIVNTVKWVIPTFIIFDACRTRQRAVIMLGVIVGLYLIYAVQVIRWMPLSAIGESGKDLASRASKITQNEIGYNRVTLSMMLAGASWVAAASLPLLRRNMHRVILLVVAGSIAFGQALTGGRTGYVTWVGVGIILAALRWRGLLLIMPVVLVVVVSVVPGVRERMMQGFGGQEGNFTVATSEYEMTSGRDIAWPAVMEEIGKSPFIGNGRQAMVTTGVRDYLWDAYGESFPHPHQAYLEQLLDNGFLGFLLIIPIYFYALLRSVPLLMERQDPLLCAIGCASFCLVLALMVGALGGQTFYPREGSVGMWAAIGLMLRAAVQRKHALETGELVFPDRLPEKYFVSGDLDGAIAPPPQLSPEPTSRFG